MSWSFYSKGTKEVVLSDLASDRVGYSPESKAEYEKARPHLEALVNLHVNVPQPPTGGFVQIIEVRAGGSQHRRIDVDPPQQTYGQVNVEIKSELVRVAV